jgi:PAS domain S-box-containing protein
VTSQRSSDRRFKGSFDAPAEAAFEPPATPDAGFRTSPGRIRRPISARSARDRGLAQLAQKALEATDVEELLRYAAPLVAKSLTAACCAVFAYERSRETLRLVAAAGWAKEGVGREVPLADEPSARLAIERGTALIRPGGRQRLPFSTLLRSRGPASGILVSIQSRSTPFGVLGVFSRPDVVFGREESRHLRAVGRMLGMAVDRLQAEEIQRQRFDRLRAIYGLTTAIGRARRMDEVYEQALDTLQRTLLPDRLAVLLADTDGVMRFNAWRNLSPAYRARAEGHSPWPADAADPRPTQVPDVLQVPELAPLLPAIQTEGIRAMGFIPLVYQARLLGELMLYYDAPRVLSEDDLRLTQTVASHVAFSVGRMRAEEALGESDERLRMVIGNAPIVLFATDRNGVFTLAEGRGLSAIGIQPGEVVGRSTLEMYQRMPQVCTDLKRALAGESFLSVVEMSGLVFESWYRPLYDAAGDLCGAAGVATDITMRRRAEEALRQSEQKYRGLFEHANDVIFIIDPDTHRLLEANEKAVQRLGYTREELRNKMLDDICPALSDGGLVAVAEAVKAGGSLIFEHRHRRKDGMEIPVETSSRLIEYGGRKVLLHFVRDIAERKNAEDALRRAHDELEQRVRERTANLLAACERLEQEIEQRHRAEDKIRERETELAHVTRLSTMGEMAATMAHELNQPLAAIANYAGGCLRRLQAGTISQAHLLEATEQITAQAQRAGEIIHRLRSFVRKREPRRTRVDVNEAVREAIGFSLPEARRFGVAMKLDLAQKLPAVLADLVQLEQVILNLLRNGIEAMRGTRGADRLLTVATATDGRFVEVSVRDHGAGLSAESTERLFHPFFTTKPHGMGMGLAISHSIVSAHGGRLWAESLPDAGTVFRFTVPIPGDSSHES